MDCCSCFTKRISGKVLLLGLPDSGKTTLLYTLKLQQTVTTIPTHGFNAETVTIGQNNREIWDIGGRIEDRNDYLFSMEDVAAVIFLIDSSSTERRYSLALTKLQLMLSEDGLSKPPVALVLNKDDLETTLTIDKVTKDIADKPYMANRFWRVFSISATTKTGLPLLLKWIYKNFGRVKKDRKVQKSKPRKKRKRPVSKISHRSFNFHANRRDVSFHFANHTES